MEPNAVTAMQTVQLRGWLYEFIVAAEVPIMGRLGLVFKILFNGAAACRTADILSDSLTPAIERASPGLPCRSAVKSSVCWPRFSVMLVLLNSFGNRSMATMTLRWRRTGNVGQSSGSLSGKLMHTGERCLSALCLNGHVLPLMPPLRRPSRSGVVTDRLLPRCHC